MIPLISNSPFIFWLYPAKDLVLLAVSICLLKQDLLKVVLPSRDAEVIPSRPRVGGMTATELRRAARLFTDASGHRWNREPDRALSAPIPAKGFRKWIRSVAAGFSARAQLCYSCCHWLRGLPSLRAGCRGGPAPQIHRSWLPLAVGIISPGKKRPQ
jgi:hypothetical protein